MGVYGRDKVVDSRPTQLLRPPAGRRWLFRGLTKCEQRPQNITAPSRHTGLTPKRRGWQVLGPCGGRPQVGS